MKNEIATERFRPRRLIRAIVLAVLLCWALMYLGEYFGLHWVREAGGGVRASL